MAKSWFMDLMEQHDPALAQLYATNRDFAMQEGVIPHKYKVLMTLLGDALLGHAEGVKSIAQRARAMGASEEEIRETLHVAYHFGGAPALITGLNAFRQ